MTIGSAKLSAAWSLLRRRKVFVEERWNGLQDLSAATKVAVFSHFDSQGAVHDFVVHYLRQLAEAGFTVVFVSNAPRLCAATIERLRPLCGLILRRANVGYDFGAYKDGIAEVPDLQRLERLLLANDSAYGPFKPLRDIIDRMDDSADIWGITDSWEYHHHLQSYFLLFGSTALQSACFSRFWSRFRYVNSKHWIISQAEIALSRELSSGGLRCQALYPYRTAALALRQALQAGRGARIGKSDRAQRLFLARLAAAIERDRPVNGTHFFWDYLIARQGCPFLKRELLRDNPMRVPFVRNWKTVVASVSSYDTALIASHLALSLGNRPVPDPVPPGRPYQPWFVDVTP